MIKCTASSVDFKISYQVNEKQNGNLKPAQEREKNGNKKDFVILSSGRSKDRTDKLKSEHMPMNKEIQLL